VSTAHPDANPRAAAQARLDALAPDIYAARVLEPSPPAATAPPWFADDPVAAPAPAGRRIVSPVPGGDVTWEELARDDPSLAAWCAARWLGPWPELAPIADDDAWTAGRGAWQTLTEHVLAPARHRANGKIGLRYTHGGVGTPFFSTDHGEQQVRLDGTDLAVLGDHATRVPITTLRAAHAAVGVPPGARTLVYEPVTPDDLDAPLAITPGVATGLAAWYGFATSVLEALRAGDPDAAATRAQVWPEHFDVSIDLGDQTTGRRGTFGASPGDGAHTRPYLYVTHWAHVAPDPFWNDTSFDGASLGYDALVGPRGRQDALAFYAQGTATLGTS
jgi:hypothetical protein